MVVVVDVSVFPRLVDVTFISVFVTAVNPRTDRTGNVSIRRLAPPILMQATHLGYAVFHRLSVTQCDRIQGQSTKNNIAGDPGSDESR